MKLSPGFNFTNILRASFLYEIFFDIGTMSADILKREMAHAIQLKWTFLALKWAALCLKIVSNFSKKATPANS